MIFGQDTFIDTAGVTLDSHTPELGGPWVNIDGGHFGTAIITASPANHLRVGQGVSSAIYILSANPGDQDYTVEDDMTVQSLAPIDSLALMLHSQNNTLSFANQFYYAWYQGSLQRWVAFGHPGVGVFNQVLTVGQTYRRKFYTTGGGTVLNLDIDGVNVISFANTSPYPLIGWAGIIATGGGSPGSDSIGYLSDNFIAYTGVLPTTAEFGLYFAGSGLPAGEDFAPILYGAPTVVDIVNPQAGVEYAIPCIPLDLAGFQSGKMGSIKLRQNSSVSPSPVPVVIRGISIQYRKKST